MDAYTRDVVRETSAASHRDQPGTDKQHARRYSTSRRTQARHRESGPPALRAAQEYILASPDPLRAFATIKATEIHARLARMSTAELMERYREVVRADKEGEAQDTVHDCCQVTPWLERAISSERDAAHDLEKAALERIFAARRVPLPRGWDL